MYSHEPAVVTSAKEKAYDYVEDCLRAGFDWHEVIRALKQAWISVHSERAARAIKETQQRIEP